MASLFDKDHRYTRFASEIDVEAYWAIEPIFRRFVEQGFSPREISHVVHGSVTDVELETVLGWPAERKV